MRFYVIYLLCGLGVMLAMDDDDGELQGCAGLFIFVLFVAAWPLVFMYTVTAALRKAGAQSVLQRHEQESATQPRGSVRE